MTYRIESTGGTLYGYYEGDTPREALQAMLAEANADPDDASTGTIEDWTIEPMDETMLALCDLLNGEVRIDYTDHGTGYMWRPVQAGPYGWLPVTPSMLKELER